MSLNVELVSPERLLFQGEAKLVVARTSDGEIGFEPGHIPFVGTLLPAPVKVISPEGDEQLIAVHSGFVELSNDHLTLLSDVSELAQDIDVDRARAALDRADMALSADSDNVEATAAKARATTRLRTAGQL